MRRKNREVTDFEEMVSIMKRCDVCRIALNDENVPYILPLNSALTVKDGKVTLWFHGATEGHKYELIAKDPHCSFEMDCSHKVISDVETMYCTFQYESVIGRGIISIVPDEEKVAALQAINNTYHPEGFPVNMASLPRTTVMKLEVESMTAKSNVGKVNMKGQSKPEKYEKLLAKVRSIVEGETDKVSIMANVASLIHEEFSFWWTGFYIVRGGELVLGPFHGPVACMHIQKGKGVCGTAWNEDRTVIVPDVDKFPGHIACSSASRSEIVVPVRCNGEVVAVLDIDSERLGTFDDTDALWLEKIVTCL